MEHTGFTNDNKTITKTITFGIKNGPCETLPFFPLFLSLSFPFSCLFLYSSFSFSFPFTFPSSFPFSFPFPFLFLSFSFPFPFVSFFLSLSLSFRFLFPFPFLFLSLSFSFPFPLPFLFCPFPSFTIPFPFPFPRWCEFFDQGVKPALGKTIRGKKPITSGKTIWKGSGFLQTFIYIQINTVYTYLHILILIRWAYIIWLVVWNGFYLSIYWECHPPSWRTPSFFRGVAQNHQPDIDLYSYRWCTY